jgi:hypothetical protein
MHGKGSWYWRFIAEEQLKKEMDIKRAESEATQTEQTAETNYEQKEESKDVQLQVSESAVSNVIESGETMDLDVSLRVQSNQAFNEESQKVVRKRRQRKRITDSADTDDVDGDDEPDTNVE